MGSCDECSRLGMAFTINHQVGTFMAGEKDALWSIDFLTLLPAREDICARRADR